LFDSLPSWLREPMLASRRREFAFSNPLFVSQIPTYSFSS
jgi:hypothetical protein